MNADTVARLAPGTRLQRDAARGGWVLLAPERMVVVDDIAHDVLQLCDGRSIQSVCTSLAEQYDAPAELILNDVLTLLGQLCDKGYLRHD